MGHHHDHHSHTKNRKVLVFAFLFTTAFSLFEIFSGYFLHTLALLSEGIHMLSDGVSLGLGALATVFASKLATSSKTFGYRRIETIAAFLNGLALLFIPIYVVYEAVLRFMHPKAIVGENMMVVAVIGLIINLIVAFALSRGDSDNLNVKAASLHVLADLFSSISVITASILIMVFDIKFIDPLVSSVVSVVIFIGGWKVTKESFHILMEGTPEEMDVENFKNKLLSINGVVDLTDFKSWSLNHEEHFSTFHLKVVSTAVEQDVLHSVSNLVSELDIHLHTTVQITK